ncbi:MAG: cysteine dioxygenase family protein [bacterium]|nr:cysteine dioxygenase family protein [bacterium]
MQTESWHRWITDITLDIPAGTILGAIQEMVRISRFSNARVHADINDIWMCVSPDETSLEVMELYKQANRERNLAEKARRKKKPCYKREVLYADAKMEIVRIVWLPGSKSRPHDHGKSHGVTIVLKGSVFEKVFDKKTKMFLRSEIHPANLNASFDESPRLIHIIGNARPDMEAITLHIYMPPLKMKFYDDLA